MKNRKQVPKRYIRGIRFNEQGNLINRMRPLEVFICHGSFFEPRIPSQLCAHGLDCFGEDLVDDFVGDG